MKSCLIPLAALLLTGLLLGCSPAAQPAETSAPTTDAPTPSSTAPTVSVTEPAAEAPTEPSTEATESQVFVPYLQKIGSPDQPIHRDPAEDADIVDTVRVAGTYTIVAEARDAQGSLWGKLKSGAGWVNLTQIREFLENPPALTAGYADDALLRSGSYHHYAQPGLDEYGVAIVFRASQRLTDVQFFSMILNETLEVGQVLSSLPELTPELPFVAEVMFPGDMTTFGIRFTDSQGRAHAYSIYISGRDGSLVLSLLDTEP